MQSMNITEPVFTRLQPLRTTSIQFHTEFHKNLTGNLYADTG